MKQNNFANEAANVASRIFLEPQPSATAGASDHVGVSGGTQSLKPLPWYRRIRKCWFAAGGAVLGGTIVALLNH